MQERDDTGPSGNEQAKVFARRVLLAVTGLSPQVVTETVYALSRHPEGRAVPTEIQLLTTAEGAQRALLSLLSDEPGWFRRLCADYRLPAIRFDANDIHVVEDAAGRPLEDIRTLEDNERVADLVTDKVRELTADPNTSLHVSIAGGRKTMGFYLGYALSLYGRPQDRLSHVLVSEPFESSWDFFYPTPESRVIATRDNKLVDTAQARVTLADIPFVSLRHGLPEALVVGKASFSEVVGAARRSLGPRELVIDLAGRRIRAAGTLLELAPAPLALLAVFARRALAGAGPLSAPPKGAPDPGWAQRYMDEYLAIRGEMAGMDETERALSAGMQGDYFSSRLSILRRRLRQGLGPAAGPYLIDDGGTRPRRYALALPPSAIRFAPVMGKPDGGHTDTKFAVTPG